MRRWVWRVLLIIAVMAALTIGASAADEEISGSFGYTLEGAGYTITSYLGNSTTVTLPSEYKDLPVTKIGDGVFSGKGLTSIKNLGNITEIGDKAFAASSLNSIEIPAGVTRIGESAFATCSSLTSVTFLDGAETGTGSANTEIGPKAFAACGGLSTLTLSGGVSSIGDSAFLGCGGLTEVYVWKGTSSIGPSAFSGCGNLSKVAISGEVTNIGAGAFVVSDKLKVIHYGGDPFPASAQWTGEVHKATVENIVTPAKCETKGASAKIVLCLQSAVGCPSLNAKKEIKELGHDISKALISSEPASPKDCQDHTDTYKDTCSRCSYTRTYEVEEGAKTSHTWGKEEADTASSVQPTDCKTPGVKRFSHTCTVCGFKELTSKTEPIPALAHTYDDGKFSTEPIKDATCTEAGLEVKYQVCDVCGKVNTCETCEELKGNPDKETDYITHVKSSHDYEEPAAKGHTKGAAAYVVTQEPSCLDTGKEEWWFVCSVCKEPLSELPDDIDDHPPVVLPAAGHKPERKEEDKDLSTPGTCLTDGEIVYKETTCTVCKNKFTPPPEIVRAPGEHKYKDVDEEIIKDSTCKETGLKNVGAKKCTECGDEVPAQPEIIPKKAHAWGSPVKDENPGEGKENKDPNCGEPGVEYVIVTCQNKLADGTLCGEMEHRAITLPATGEHKWGEWETKEPTLTQAGEKKRTCETCGKEDKIVLPATGEPSKPDDPDNPDEPEKPKSYQVTTVQGAGGTASANRTAAQAGDRITITVSPSSGYELDMVRVIAANGKVPQLESLGGGQYRFTMPEANVEIRATFQRKNSGPGWAAAPEDGSAGNPRRTTDVMPAQNPTLDAPRTDASQQLFRDVPMSHWAAGEINWANQMGYMNGTAGRFNPDGTISHQQLWMVLARLTGSNPGSMEAARRWAVQGGFADGSAPTAPVKRHQLVTALYRCARLSGSTNRNTTSLAGYTDSRTVPAVARDAFSWALANGIISGSADKTLAPNGTLTRAQFAVILYRYSQRI